MAVKRPHSHWPPVLQRLFVSHNRIVALEELRPLADMGKLQEVALDGNPISSMLHPREYRKKVCWALALRALASAALLTPTLAV